MTRDSTDTAISHDSTLSVTSSPHSEPTSSTYDPDTVNSSLDVSFLTEEPNQTPTAPDAAPSAPSSPSAPSRPGFSFGTWLFGSVDPAVQEYDIYVRTPIMSTLKIAGPPTLSYLAGGLVLFSDFAVIGNLVGPSGIAAMSYASGFDPLVRCCAAFTGVGGAQMVSNALGAGHTEDAEKALGVAFFGNFLFSVFGTALIYPLMGYVIQLAQAPEEFYQLAYSYAQPLVIGMFVSIFNRSLGGLLLAEGRSILSCAANLLMTVLNALFGLAFTYAGLGIRGASIASVSASAVSATCLMVFYATGKATVHLRWKHIIPRDRAFFKMLGTMIFVGLGDVIGSFSTFVVNLAVAAVSTTVLSNTDRYTPAELQAGLAASGTLSTYLGLVFEIFTGLSSAGLIPLLSFADGRRDRTRFWLIIRANVIVSFVVSVLLTIVCVGGAPLLVRAFGSDPLYVHMATKVMRVALSSIVLLPAQFYSITAAQSLGMGMHAGFISLFAYVVFLPCFYALYGLTTGNYFLTSLAFPSNDISSIVLSFIALIIPITRRTRYDRQVKSHWDIIAMFWPTRRVRARAEAEVEEDRRLRAAVAVGSTESDPATKYTPACSCVNMPCTTVSDVEIL